MSLFTADLYYSYVVEVRLIVDVSGGLLVNLDKTGPIPSDFTHKFVLLSKESLNIDGRQYHRTKQNDQHNHLWLQMIEHNIKPRDISP